MGHMYTHIAFFDDLQFKQNWTSYVLVFPKSSDFQFLFKWFIGGMLLGDREWGKPNEMRGEAKWGCGFSWRWNSTRSNEVLCNTGSPMRLPPRWGGSHGLFSWEQFSRKGDSCETFRTQTHRIWGRKALHQERRPGWSANSIHPRCLAGKCLFWECQSAKLSAS